MCTPRSDASPRVGGIPLSHHSKPEHAITYQHHAAHEVVSRRQLKPAPPSDVSHARSKCHPIACAPASAAYARNPAWTARNRIQRMPSNDYVPRGCNHCGMSFVPRETGSATGKEFCSGECQHSFAFLRHNTRRSTTQISDH